MHVPKINPGFPHWVLNLKTVTASITVALQVAWFSPFCIYSPLHLYTNFISRYFCICMFISNQVHIDTYRHTRTNSTQISSVTFISFGLNCHFPVSWLYIPRPVVSLLLYFDLEVHSSKVPHMQSRYFTKGLTLYIYWLFLSTFFFSMKTSSLYFCIVFLA